MKKALKIVGGIAVVLVLLLVAAAAFVTYKFDPTWAKQELTRVIKEQKQRTLVIEGDVGLSFFPSLGVRLGKTTLSEFQSGKQFAGIDNAKVSVRLIPLLSKKIEVDHVDLSGVRAVIIRRKDGSFNFDDLMSKKKEQEESATVKFDIAGIGLTGAIDYRDEGSGQAYRFDKLAIKTGRIANVAKGAIKFSGHFADKTNALTLDLGADYDIDVDAQRFALSGLKGKVNGDAAGLKQMAFSLDARTLALALQKNELDIDGLKGEIKALLGGETMEAKIAAPRLAITGEKASGEAVNGEFSLGGKARQINGKLNIGALQGSPESIKIDKIALQWDFRQGTTVVRGQLASPAQGNFKTRIFNLDKLSGSVDIENPAMPMKQLKLPVSGNVEADLGKTTFGGAFSTRFDETSLQSNWKILHLAPFSASLDLGIDRLNVDRYFPPAPAKTAATGGSAAAGNVPVDLSILRVADVKGSVRIGFLQVKNIKISNLKAPLQLAKGRLDVSPMSAEAYQGSIAGSVSANAQGNRIAVKQAMSNVNIGPLLKDAANKDIIEGRGAVHVDVNTGGASVNAMKQALGGTASLQLRDGAIKGINLAASLRDFKSKFSSKQTTEQKAKQGEKTDFSEISASFKIANGIARNDDLAAKSPFLRLSGAGTIDLVRSQLDYKTKVSVVGTSKGQEGAGLDQLKGATIPVQLVGPFDNLSYKIDFASMAGEILQSKAKEEVTKALEKKAGDKLGDKLKGLFKK